MPEAAALLKKAVLRLERATNNNLTARAKYPTQPQRFVDTELELEEALRALQAISADSDDPRDDEALEPAQQFLSEWLRLELIASLVALLGHENADISTAVIDLLNDLTADIPTTVPQDLTGQLLSTILNEGVPAALVNNLERILSEGTDSGLDTLSVPFGNTLDLLDNIYSINPEKSSPELIHANGGSLPLFLLARLRDPTESPSPEQVSCAEFLAALVESGQKEASQALVAVGAITLMVTTLVPFRNGISKGTSKSVLEIARNITTTLSTCLYLSPEESTAQFIAADGCELMLLLTQATPRLRKASLQCLEFAVMGGGLRTVDRIMSAGGLGVLFGIWKAGNAQSPAARSAFAVITAVCRSVTGSSSDVLAMRRRVTTKFIGGNSAKLRSLLDAALKLTNALEVEPDGKKFSDDLSPEDEETQYLQQLDRGLQDLQNLCFTAAWVANEAPSALATVDTHHPDFGRKHIRETLAVLHQRTSPTATQQLSQLSQLMSGLQPKP